MVPWARDPVGRGLILLSLGRALLQGSGVADPKP